MSLGVFIRDDANRLRIYYCTMAKAWPMNINYAPSRFPSTRLWLAENLTSASKRSGDLLAYQYQFDSAPRCSKTVTKQRQEDLVNMYESNICHSSIRKFANWLAGACIPKTGNTTACQGRKGIVCLCTGLYRVSPVVCSRCLALNGFTGLNKDDAPTSCISSW